MMDFIVLGIIPGTHTQLTFSGYQLVLIGVAVFAAYKILKYSRGIKSPSSHDFDIISLQSLEQV